MSTVNTYAIVDAAGNVVNIVLWDGSASWQPPTGCQAIQSETAAIGWIYANGTFTEAT